jgi:hypothetical protein
MFREDSATARQVVVQARRVKALLHNYIGRARLPVARCRNPGRRELHQSGHPEPVRADVAAVVAGQKNGRECAIFTLLILILFSNLYSILILPYIPSHTYLLFLSPFHFPQLILLISLIF